MTKATAPPGAVAVNVALPETVCDGLGEVITGAALDRVTATWVEVELHRSLTLQSTALTVWAPFGRPHEDHTADAVPLLTATGAPTAAPSTRKRTLAAAEAAVRVTGPDTAAPLDGVVSAGTLSGRRASKASRKSTWPAPRPRPA